MSLTPTITPIQQFFDNAGNPAAGASLYTYEAGTSTPLTVYTDSDGTIPYSNPIVLDSAGRPSGPIYPPATPACKYVLKDSGGATLWTADDIFPAAVAS